MRAVRDFALLLPPGWARLPLDDRVPLRVKNLVAERVAAAPRRRRAELRALLTRELTAVLESAAGHGAIDVLLSVDPVAGRPVPASCLVTYLERRGDGGDLDVLVGALAPRADSPEVCEVDRVEVAGGPAVRRLTTRREQLPAEGGALVVTQLDYVVPLPGSGGLLVLTFTTPIEQLGPPLVKLFDVMGSSLRWVSA